MIRCSRCQKRKAKRHCPGLNGALCPLCCGLLREKEIHCPSGCTFLARHKPYQERRIIQKKGPPAEEAPPDERLNWLILHIEAPLRDAAAKNPGFTDRDAVLALEYARARVEKGRPKLIVSSPRPEAKNAVGEAVLESLERCRYEKALILPHDICAYTTDEKLGTLDRVVRAAKRLAGGRLEGRAYLDRLSRMFAALEESSREKRILTRG